MTRAIAAALLLALAGCGFTQQAERGLKVAGQSVANLKADADRNLEQRLALSRWVAQSELERAADGVGAQTGGVVTVGFAKRLVGTALEMERRISSIEAAERANIDGNAGNAAQLLGVVIEGSTSSRAALEATGPALRAAIAETLAAKQKLDTARAAEKAREERERKAREAKEE